MAKPNYFLVSVSIRQNLELCLKHAVAGFTNSTMGAWTFVEIREGDFISFLYAARVFNLYEVTHKEAIKGTIAELEQIPPLWKPVTFGKRTYHFPFRLYLKPVREFCEPIVRPEFAYVAENLLLRGGYYKTHFQADQTTLQNVSQMGNRWNGTVQPLDLPEHENFELRFTTNKAEQKIPFICPFEENILQAAIRQHLSETQNLTNFLALVGMEHLNADELEVLGEKALSEGHVDILIKDRVPIARARKIAVEVKRRKAQRKNLMQLRGYMDELGDECLLGVLIAETFPRTLVREAEKYCVRLVRYELPLDLQSPRSFSEILNALRLCL